MLLAFLLTEYFTVPADSFPPILAANHGNFLFVHIHSAAAGASPLASAWAELRANPPPIPALTLGEVLCPAPPAACAGLPGVAPPAAVWLDPAFNLSVPLSAARAATAGALAEFARRMRTYPLTVGVDWEQARSGSDPWSPAPFVACPEGDFARVFPLLKRVFCRVGKAAAVQWGAPLRLQVLRAGFKEVTFGGRWVDDDMCEWLRRATIARCELLTAQMFALLAEKGSPIVHFFIEPDRTAEEWMRFVQLFPPHQYSYLPYDPLSPFVDLFHARDLPLPAAIYYDPRTQFQTLYTGELAYQDLGDWLAEIGSNETIPPPPPNRAQERRRGLPAAPVWVCVAVVSGAVACVRRRGALRLPAAFRARLAL